MTSGTSCLCCGTLLLFAFKVAPNQWEILFIDPLEKSLSPVEWHLDSSLPCQKATVRSLTTYVADIFFLGEDVAAKHESPDLSPCLAKLNGETINTSRLAHEKSTWTGNFDARHWRRRQLISGLVSGEDQEDWHMQTCRQKCNHSGLCLPDGGGHKR